MTGKFSLLENSLDINKYNILNLTFYKIKIDFGYLFAGL